MPSVLVIGAGISGLTSAYALKKAGWSVTVLESSNEPGGAIRSQSADGFLSESGPNSFMVQTRTQKNLLGELGLEGEQLTPGPDAKKRYLVRDGKVLAAPSGPWSALTTPLFSFPAKLRILGEPWTKRPANLVEESLAAFVQRRLGQEVLDYAMNPFVGGIYAGDPAQLSVQEGFPKLAALEKNHGSLIRGAIAKMKARRAAEKAGEDPFKPFMASFAKGLQTLPRALDRELPGDVFYGARLLGLCGNTRWHASWEGPGGEHGDDFDRVILAVPAHTLAELPLPDSLRQALAPLTQIPHPPLMSLFLGYKRGQVRHPLDGFGMLVPAVEKRNLLGVLFSSTLFPARAPKDHVALTAFVGGTRQPDLARMPADKVFEKVRTELQDLLGVHGDPVVMRPTFWPKAIPQYVMGYGRFRECMEKAEAKHPGLHLLGNYRGGIALGQCIDNALTLADGLTHV